MKEKLNFLLVLLLSSVLFFSCSKDDDDNNTGTTPTTFTQKFSFDADGTPYTATTIFGSVVAGRLTIVTASTGSSANLVMPSDITPGTYNLSFIGSHTVNYSVGGTTSYASDSGTLTITSHNKTLKQVKGSFSFSGREFPTGTATSNVTNGKFKAKY